MNELTPIQIGSFEGLSAHSPLGASGASRWMKCPASYVYSKGVEDPSSDHARLGTAAHTLGEHCLTKGDDAWMLIGQEFDGFVVDKPMADAVQVYLDAVRQAHPGRNQSNFFVERRFHCPTIHDLFYGTSDCIYLDEANSHLHVWDYKHGAGIVIEAEENPQLMYYGCGVLEELDLWMTVDHVTLYVAQPRGFHWKGPIRHWHTTVDFLQSWLEDVLVPSMDRATISTQAESGEHCRFCPARLRACPRLDADMNELEQYIMQTMDKGTLPEWTDEQLARFMDLHELSKIVQKSASELAFGRLQQGRNVPGWKLTTARANREWKDGAEPALKKAYKDQAYEPAKLKSPAGIDKLPGGGDLTARWAVKPDAGLTLAKASDPRRSVNKDTKSMFTPTKRKKD